MGIIELLQKIGEDNVRLQPLDQCVTDMKMSRGINKYTFESEVSFSLDGPQKMGLVVWLDRDKVKTVIGK